MICLFVFIALFFGLNIHRQPIVYVIFSLLLLLITFNRFGLKKSLLILGIIAIGILLSLIKINSNGSLFDGIVIDSYDNYIIVWSKFEKIYLYNKNNNYEIGDILRINGMKRNLSFNVVESSFDFKQFLNNKGVFYQIDNTKIEILFSNPIKLKQYKNNFLNNFDENTRSLLSSILFSNFEESDITGLLSELHLNRLASSSGIYVYAFINFVYFLLNLKLKKKTSKILAPIILLPYWIFTFPKFSIIRILTLYYFRIFNKYKLKEKFCYVELISLTAIFFLLIDYHLAYQDSFILGFFVPIIVFYVNSVLIKKRKIVRKLILIISILMFFIPFEIQYFNEISFFSSLWQVMVSPLFILIAVTSLLCFYKIPIYFIPSTLTKGATNLLSWIHYINLKMYIPKFNDIVIAIYYLLLLSLFIFRAINYKPISRFVLIAYLSLLTLYSLPVNNLITEEVDFINVGQGDSCLIRKGLTTILIDTGGSIYQDIAKECLIPYLKSKRIYNIDYLITTHDDFDHSGGKESLKTNFIVKNIIDDYKLFPLSISGINFVNYNNFVDKWNEENDESLVIGFELTNRHFLITGDATIKIEKLIVNSYTYIPCDVLKVGHHGSDTSTSDLFLKYLKPKEAIISVGRNSYGHPSSKILNRLSKYNIAVFRTDRYGTIAYKSFI